MCSMSVGYIFRSGGRKVYAFKNLRASFKSPFIEWPSLYMPSSMQCIIKLFYCGHSDKLKWYFLVLICISLIINEVVHQLIYQEPLFYDAVFHDSTYWGIIYVQRVHKSYANSLMNFITYFDTHVTITQNEIQRISFTPKKLPCALFLSVSSPGNGYVDFYHYR